MQHEVVIGLASVMVWINGKHVGGLVEYPEGWGANSRLSTNYPELKGQHHDREGWRRILEAKDLGASDAQFPRRA